MQLGADGVIMSPAIGTPLDDIDLVLRNGLPVVLIARSIPRARLPVFRGDDAFGTGLATKHLISLGHKRIAMIGGTDDTSTGRDRYQGYLAAMQKAELPAKPEWRIPGPRTKQAGFEAASEFLALPDKPTAAVCWNDLVAIGLMNGIRRAGLVPGIDISVTGYDDLEEAAQQMLDVLYGDEDTVENLLVSVVPFDTRVNLKNYTGNVGFTPSNADRVCANPRPAPYTTAEANPAASAFSSEYTQWSRGCKATPALALTAEKSTIEDVLADMDDNGYTRIDVGAAWAHRMLSPDWRGLWGDAELPLDYNTPLMDKAAIIMTDGENNPKDGTSKATANARLLEACTSMKNDNIIVYTIQYREDDEDLQDMLRNCATSPSHYFYAEDDDLTAVFNEIANQLSNLRLLNVM